jgi:hypothetical protein
MFGERCQNNLERFQDAKIEKTPPWLNNLRRMGSISTTCLYSRINRYASNYRINIMLNLNSRCFESIFD